MAYLYSLLKRIKLLIFLKLDNLYAAVLKSTYFLCITPKINKIGIIFYKKIKYFLVIIYKNKLP